MRTELTLDDDVAAFVEEQSRVQNKPLDQVVNETLRLGMTQSTKPADTQEFRVKPNEGGFVEGIDTVRLNQVLDDLDVEEFPGKGRTLEIAGDNTHAIANEHHEAVGMSTCRVSSLIHPGAVNQVQEWFKYKHISQ